MSILDKIIGKKEEAEKPQPEAGQPLAEEKKALKVKAENPAKIIKSKKTVTKKRAAKREENIAHKILLENLISEKASFLASQNKYLFRVHSKADKMQIKAAIEGYYGVRVTGVNTIKIHPKKRIHGRTIGWKKGFKKAIVTLREGDTIAAVEGI